MTRRVLVAVAVLALVATAGCTTLFGSDVADPGALSANETYAFDVDRDASITINRNNYTAVYNVSAKTTGGNDTMTFHRTDALSVERPLELSALQFRYPNGTLVRYVDGQPTRIYPNGTRKPTDALAVRATRERTVVELPADAGRLAFTAPKSGKQLAVRTVVNGSYRVALPPNTDAAIPVLSQVRPPNDDRGRVGERVVLLWSTVDAPVLLVRWYLDRDIWLFGGLAAIAAVVGLVGSLYYLRAIRRARARREDEDLDVDTGDGRDPPPPGMR